MSKKRGKSFLSFFRICYAMFSSRKKEEKRKNFLPLKKHYLMLGQSEGISVGIIRETLFRQRRALLEKEISLRNYYVKVRAYKTIDGKQQYYGTYSSVKRIKVK